MGTVGSILEIIPSSYTVSAGQPMTLDVGVQNISPKLQAFRIVVRDNDNGTVLYTGLPFELALGAVGNHVATVTLTQVKTYTLRVDLEYSQTSLGGTLGSFEIFSTIFNTHTDNPYKFTVKSYDSVADPNPGLLSNVPFYVIADGAVIGSGTTDSSGFAYDVEVLFTQVGTHTVQVAQNSDGSGIKSNILTVNVQQGSADIGQVVLTASKLSGTTIEDYPFEVLVRDISGNPIPEVPNWIIVDGTYLGAERDVQTDSTGKARFTVQGLTPGQHTVKTTANMPSGSVDSNVVTLNVVAAAGVQFFVRNSNDETRMKVVKKATGGSMGSITGDSYDKFLGYAGEMYELWGRSEVDSREPASYRVGLVSETSSDGEVILTNEPGRWEAHVKRGTAEAVSTTKIIVSSTSPQSTDYPYDGTYVYVADLWFVDLFASTPPPPEPEPEPEPTPDPTPTTDQTWEYAERERPDKGYPIPTYSLTSGSTGVRVASSGSERMGQFIFIKRMKKSDLNDKQLAYTWAGDSSLNSNTQWVVAVYDGAITAEEIETLDAFPTKGAGKLWSAWRDNPFSMLTDTIPAVDLSASQLEDVTLVIYLNDAWSADYAHDMTVQKVVAGALTFNFVGVSLTAGVNSFSTKST